MKILIADDDPIIRQVLMNLLSKWGYGVVPTTNGAEAWEVLQHDPELRIGLFDWFMPEVNGMELTRRIREANIAPFYVMLVTARGGKDSMLEALDAIAQKALEKKTGARGLRSIIENAMLEVMYDIPSNTSVKEVIITPEVILGTQPPMKVYHKEAVAS